ncbi:MAG: hypothetical protein ACFFF9_06760 [Candidatus Thorarchaeota archaeon]
MRKPLILLFLLSFLILGSPTFTSASTDYEWVIQVGNRYDYSWSVEDESKTVLFQQNFYVIIEELSEIPSNIDPADVWTLAETGFNVSLFWKTGIGFEPSDVGEPFGFNLLPVGDWTQLIDAFPKDAGFLNNETLFAYEYYDIVLGNGEHKEVQFRKSDGVVQHYHMHEYADSVALYGLDIILTSSTPVMTTTTTSSDTTTSTLVPSESSPAPSMSILIMAAGGSVVIVVLIMYVIKRRV